MKGNQMASPMACDLIFIPQPRKLPEISHKTVQSGNFPERRKLVVSHFWLPLLKSLNQSDFLKIKISNPPKSIKY